MIVKFFLLFISVVLGFVVAGCQDANSNRVNWIYTIPDEYMGWIAIQYECEDGQPLREEEDVIEVVFGPDGLFCTSDSKFMWDGQISARNQSGLSIPFYSDNQGETGYGVCCLRGVNSQRIRDGREINMSVDILWVGNMEQSLPDTDTFFESFFD